MAELPPEQRGSRTPSTKWFLYIAIGALLQALKGNHYLNLEADVNTFAAFSAWSIMDVIHAILAFVPQVSGSNPTKPVVAIWVTFILALNAALFRNEMLNPAPTFGHLPQSRQNTVSYPANRRENYQAAVEFPESVSHFDSYLSGEHVIERASQAVALLNPDNLPFCLNQAGDSVFVPLLLKELKVHSIQYNFDDQDAHREGAGYGKPKKVSLTARHLKVMEQNRAALLKKPSGFRGELVDTGPALAPSQSFVYLQIRQPGTLRLEQVLASSDVAFDFEQRREVTVALCPRAEFLHLEEDDGEVKVAGDNSRFTMMVDVYGVVPITLGWSHTINGKHEQLRVEVPEPRDLSMQNPGYGSRDEPSGRSREDRFMPGVASAFTYPLTVTLNLVGNHLFMLDYIVDALGNQVQIESQFRTTDQSEVKKTRTSLFFSVLERPRVFFKDCTAKNTARHLIGGETPLVIVAEGSDAFENNWEVMVRYDPPQDADRKLSPWERTFRPAFGRKELLFPATAPGEYSIVHAKGKWCDGEIISPTTCKVVQQQLPSLRLNWIPMRDCQGVKAVRVDITFDGTPPFQLVYEIQRNKEAPQQIEKSFLRLKEALVLEPILDGHYIYSFLQISDDNYKKVPVLGQRLEQDISVTPSAIFIGGLAGPAGRIISTCETAIVPVEVELRGRAPWSLSLEVVGGEVLQFHKIATPRTTLDIPIPASVSSQEKRQNFQVKLLTIQDARGCEQEIRSDLLINLLNNKPTVAFSGDGLNVTVLEQEHTPLPIQLTGEGPWQIKYRRVEYDMVLTARATTPLSAIPVTEQGVYELLEVMDSHCKGNVLENGAKFQVNWVPRPYAKLVQDATVSIDPYKDKYNLKPICQDMDDFVELDLFGKPPFQLLFNIGHLPHGSTSRTPQILYQPTYNIGARRARLQLITNPPGRIVYELDRIGDALYPLVKSSPTSVYNSRIVQFEQQVATRPTARFKSQSALTYYINEPFVGSSRPSSEGVIHFEGLPPFQIRLSINNLETKQSDTWTVDSPTTSWKLEYPPYHFNTAGTYVATINAVTDASKCSHATMDASKNSITINVLPMANIIPYEQREDLCVGESPLFDFEGNPPWTISYTLAGQPFQKTTYVRPFAIRLDRPGELVITAVTNNHIQKTLTHPLRYNVHNFPSALVAHGRRKSQVIDDDGQARIEFTLIGEPPFTFTYQRTERLPDNKPGRILETDSVYGLETYSYSLPTTGEGIWTTTFVSDKYCYYPPVVKSEVTEGRRWTLGW